MMISDAPTLHVIDFIHLISGATLDGVNAVVEQQTNSGRIYSLKEFRESGFIEDSFFPRDDDRSFLEILFLKLTVLKSILQRYRERNELAQVNLRSDMIWIRIPEINHLLPSYWNFTVQIMSDINPLSSRALLPVTSADTFTNLGLLWFQVLLQNRSVSQNDLLNAVTEYLSLQSDYCTYAIDRPKLMKSLCVPENNFWNQGNACIRTEWLSFWERAGVLGYHLLDASKRNYMSNSCNEVIHSVNGLLADIKAVMFHTLPERDQVTPQQQTLNDRVLQGILQRLIEKTRHEVARTAALNSTDDFDDETMETIILAPSPMQEQGVAPSQMVDTYVNLQASSLAGSAVKSESAPADDDLLETVVIASPRTGRQHPPQVADQRSSDRLPQKNYVADDADQLSETVVIMPQGGRVRPRFPRD
jgi:hypothetical protein